MRTILSRTVSIALVPTQLLSLSPSVSDSMSWWSGPLLVLWLYLPGYLANTAAMLGGKWIPDLTGIEPRPIDGGRTLSDGYRVLGDGKTWNGLLGAVVGAGLLCMLTHALGENHLVENGIFLDPLLWAGPDDWFWIGGEWGAAFIVGAFLGFGRMVGDCTGSFIKRRLGKKREGDESSEAPLLDTVLFAIAIFIAAFVLFDGQVITHPDLIEEIIFLLIVTPIIHRAFNIFGYKVGLKEVPY